MEEIECMLDELICCWWWVAVICVLVEYWWSVDLIGSLSELYDLLLMMCLVCLMITVECCSRVYLFLEEGSRCHYNFFQHYMWNKDTILICHKAAIYRSHIRF